MSEMAADEYKRADGARSLNLPISYFSLARQEPSHICFSKFQVGYEGNLKSNH